MNPAPILRGQTHLVEQIARDRITAAYLPIPEPDTRLPKWICALFITGASLACWGVIAAALL